MDNGYINMPEGDDYENSGCFQLSHRQPEENGQYRPEAQEQSGSTPADVKKKPRIVIIIAIIAAAAVLGAAAFFLFRPGGAVSSSKLNPEVRAVEETMTNFEKAYKEADFESLTECLDSDTRDKLNKIKFYSNIISSAAGADIDIDSLLSQALGHASFGASFDIQEMKTTIDGDTAKVDAKLKIKSSIPNFSGDTEREQSFALVKEEGKWYISGLK